MAYASTLEIYKALILPRLADGPRSELRLGVPRDALEALRRAGLVQMRTRVTGSTVAFAFEDQRPHYGALIRDNLTGAISYRVHPRPQTACRPSSPQLS
jgi:hypothetical protein